MTDGDFLDDLDDLDDVEEQAPPGDADSATPPSAKLAQDAPAATAEKAKKSPRQQVTLYADEAEFMVKWLGEVISRKLTTQSGGGLRWDQDWWRYPEVVYRVRLLWGTFEVARSDPDPAKLETWTRTVLDYHLGVMLNGSTGPMSSAAGPISTLGATYPPSHPKRQEQEALTARREERRKRRAEREREEQKAQES